VKSTCERAPFAATEVADGRYTQGSLAVPGLQSQTVEAAGAVSGVVGVVVTTFPGGLDVDVSDDVVVVLLADDVEQDVRPTDIPTTAMQMAAERMTLGQEPL
jgi:hypothetical protein